MTELRERLGRLPTAVETAGARETSLALRKADQASAVNGPC